MAVMMRCTIVLGQILIASHHALASTPVEAAYMRAFAAVQHYEIQRGQASASAEKERKNYESALKSLTEKKETAGKPEQQALREASAALEQHLQLAPPASEHVSHAEKILLEAQIRLEDAEKRRNTLRLELEKARNENAVLTVEIDRATPALRNTTLKSRLLILAYIESIVAIRKSWPTSRDGLSLKRKRYPK